MWLDRGPPPCQVTSWSIQLFGHNRHGPISHKVAWTETYLHTKWHLNPCSHLAATDMGGKLEAPPPFWKREVGPHLKQCGHGQGLPACQVSSWSIQPFGHSTPASQTGQTGRQHRVNRLVPKNCLLTSSIVTDGTSVNIVERAGWPLDSHGVHACRKLRNHLSISNENLVYGSSDQFSVAVC